MFLLYVQMYYYQGPDLYAFIGFMGVIGPDDIVKIGRFLGLQTKKSIFFIKILVLNVKICRFLDQNVKKVNFLSKVLV